MKLDIDQAFEVVGSSNRYQILLAFSACISWFCADFLAVTFPVLIFYPDMQCYVKETGLYETCTESTVNDVKYDCTKLQPNIIYDNVLTMNNLYCKTILYKSMMAIYTVGIVIGAVCASKLADIYGRRFVLLISLCFYTFCIIIAGIFAHFITIVLICVFFLGIGSSGATMTSFLITFEKVNANVRNRYGIAINSCYAIAGLGYCFIFNMAKDWRVMTILSASSGIYSILMFVFYFVESPRYYLSCGNYKLCLRSLLKISHRNGNRNAFMKYLKEEILSKEQLHSLDQELINKSTYQYSEILNVINSIDYTDRTRHSSDDSLSPPKKKLSENMDVSTIKTDAADTDALTGDLEITVNQKDPGILALCKYKSIRTSFIICSVNWGLLSYVYFGMSYKTKENNNDVFANNYTIYAAEFCAYILTGLIMEIKFMGRTRTVGYAGFVTFVSCILYQSFKDSGVGGKIILYIMRFGITCVFTAMYTYATEIYPTVIRSQGLGINLTFARISTTIVPFTLDNFEYCYYLFAAFGLVFFINHFFSKETYGLKLEDQIEEIQEELDELKRKRTMESMGYDQKSNAESSISNKDQN